MLPGDREMEPYEACNVADWGRHEGILLIWTVTTGTKDHGNRFVARPHRIDKGGSAPLPVYLVADTLDALHDMLPPGLDRLPREPDDQAIIVESWL